MTELAPTIIAEHEQFGVRATFDRVNKTIISRIDTDVPCAAAATLAGKLAAFTCLMNGEGFDVFTSLAESHRRNIVWMIDDLAHEVLVLTELATALYCMPSKTEAEDNHG